MIVGVPKEIKENEYRVSITPSGVSVLKNAGHQIIIEAESGRKSGFCDEEYMDAGAIVSEDARGVWENASLIVKVGQPLLAEFHFLRKGLILFAYLPLAARPQIAEILIEKGVVAIGYDLLEINGTFPLLAASPHHTAKAIKESTIAFTTALLPYILEVCNKGIKKAMLENSSLIKGVNLANGFVTNRAIAKRLSCEFTPVKDAFRQIAFKV